MHKKGLSIEAGCGQVIRLISTRHAGLDPASSNESSKKALDSGSRHWIPGQARNDGKTDLPSFVKCSTAASAGMTIVHSES
jgi:hypothetical protein